MKVLLDTCIVLDYLMNREGFVDGAEKILEKCACQEFSGFLTSKSICDIFYLYRKYTKDASFACKQINSLLSILSLLDTTKEDVQNALSLPYTNDFEDDLMMETSFREKMDIIITRNLKDYSTSPVKVLSPNQFLQMEGEL